MLNIRYDIVGSFLRPIEIKEARAKFFAGDITLEEFMSMLDFPKNIQVRDRATLFNLVIGLNGFTVSSGIIDSKLNSSNIIAKPLDVDKTMRIGVVKKKNTVFSRYACFYMEALKKYLSIV